MILQDYEFRYDPPFWIQSHIKYDVAWELALGKNDTAVLFHTITVGRMFSPINWCVLPSARSSGDRTPVS